MNLPTIFITTVFSSLVSMTFCPLAIAAGHKEISYPFMQQVYQCSGKYCRQSHQVTVPKPPEHIIWTVVHETKAFSGRHQAILVSFPQDVEPETVLTLNLDSPKMVSIMEEAAEKKITLRNGREMMTTREISLGPEQHYATLIVAYRKRLDSSKELFRPFAIDACNVPGVPRVPGVEYREYADGRISSTFYWGDESNHNGQDKFSRVPGLWNEQRQIR